MNVHTSKWSCNQCNENGNLFRLYDLLQSVNIKRTKVYNPRGEKNQLIKMLLNIIKTHNGDTKLVDDMNQLIFKINELFNYFVYDEQRKQSTK